MYDLSPTQWAEIGWGRRALAQLGRGLPDRARLTICGLPAGVVSIAEAGDAVQLVEAHGREGLYRVPNGTVWSRGAQLDGHGRIVAEISPGVNRPPAWWMVRRQRFFPRMVRCPGTVFSMCGDDADNLYHWTFDVMPRLRVLPPERRGRVLVLARLRHPFHRASLVAAGFRPEAIVPADSMTFYETDELLAAQIEKGVTAENLALAREVYLQAAAAVPEATSRLRLYISRANATSRRVVNEAELRALLEPRGFRTVQMEKLPLAEQLALFRDAEAIISPTGAALAHLHLCRPDTRLLILMPQGCVDFLYRDMARTIGLDPHLLDVPLAPQSDPDPVKSDIVLDAGNFASVAAFIA